jgi:hypothetical protein
VQSLLILLLFAAKKQPADKPLPEKPWAFDLRAPSNKNKNSLIPG